MNPQLLTAVQDSKPWLDRFNRLEYAAAFQEYREQFAGLFQEAVRETGEAAVAEQFVEALADSRKRYPRWGRSSRTFDEKRMVVVYLTPMLREIGLEPLAASLRESWVRRWPRDSYKIASYDKLRRSFRLTVMGFEVRGHGDDEDE